ncbi:PadR family transcriptional regulator [Actinokineospora sp. PR83]|uniref:PadR family transcriptional regulator n=1 Tax=Actinokineospora sp. PR83 TaxID=2884908 RepID=UPI001F3EB195|nr:PadR family transcriptional regulator [Actinokineospora sp. PR83]MCG8918295.1 PadR family transcriptional regulator [Actinokineospora sp. PR83]
MRTTDHRRGPWRRHDHHGHPFAGHGPHFDPEAEMTPPPFPPFPPGAPFPPFGGHGGRGGRGGPFAGGRGGHRRGRGDVRAALLALLTERPMHGYEMIQEIAARSGGYWKPSPGSVYPTLQLLADEGLVRGVDGEGGKRLFELTDDGTATAAKLGDTPPWEQVNQGVDPVEHTLRNSLGQIMGAAQAVAQAASAEQKSRAVEILDNARRDLYALLGESGSTPTAE